MALYQFKKYLRKSVNFCFVFFINPGFLSTSNEEKATYDIVLNVLS